MKILGYRDATEGVWGVYGDTVIMERNQAMGNSYLEDPKVD